MDTRKAYGIVTAIGAKLGERAKDDADLDKRLRAAPDRASFETLVRDAAGGSVPGTLLDAFVREVLTDADWVQWRARLLLQLKMTRDGGKPAPGHEAGRGVGKP